MNSQFLAELGQLQARRKDFPTALATFQHAEAFAGMAQPGTETTMKGVALRGEGYVLTEQGKLDEAEAKYREALKLDPNDAKAQRELEYIRQQRAGH